MSLAPGDATLWTIPENLSVERYYVARNSPGMFSLSSSNTSESYESWSDANDAAINFSAQGLKDLYLVRVNHTGQTPIQFYGAVPASHVSTHPEFGSW